jgi:hypothetical protein
MWAVEQDGEETGLILFDVLVQKFQTILDVLIVPHVQQ